MLYKLFKLDLNENPTYLNLWAIC